MKLLTLVMACIAVAYAQAPAPVVLASASARGFTCKITAPPRTGPGPIESAEFSCVRDADNVTTARAVLFPGSSSLAITITTQTPGAKTDDPPILSTFIATVQNATGASQAMHFTINVNGMH